MASQAAPSDQANPNVIPTCPGMVETPSLKNLTYAAGDCGRTI